MREDMFKIIVERPRSGRSWARPFKLRHEKDLDRKHAGLKRSVLQQRGHTKNLNENLAPLRRYLHKQKGRKWNDVFSEICARLDTGSTVKMHVREHIEDFVMLRISIDANGRWLGVRGGWRQPNTPDEWWPDLYVDPHDNIIKETNGLLKKLRLKKKRYVWHNRQTQQRPDLIRFTNKTKGFVNLNRCWFSFVLSCDPKTRDPLISEHAVHRDIESGAWRNHLNWSVLEQKQLSKKQLKQFGLVNGKPAQGDKNVFG